MRLPRLVPFLLAVLVLLAIGAGPAGAAGAGGVYGKTTNRYGPTKFTVRGNSIINLTVSKRIAKRSANKTFSLDCRTRKGKYQAIIRFVSFENTRRFNSLGGLSDLGAPAYRCRAKRGSLVFATMRVRKL